MENDLLSIEAIKREIYHAFRRVTLDGGISLEQTKVIDNYGRGVTDEEFGRLPLSEVTDDWTKIPVQVLDEAECLAFLDAKGFRYYIPALMIRLMENYDAGSMMSIGTIRGLGAQDDHYKSRYEFLSDQQGKAIAHYIQALPHHVALDREDAVIVNRSFDRYWGIFLR